VLIGTWLGACIELVWNKHRKGVKELEGSHVVNENKTWRVLYINV
jgi:hypothetical protein